MFLLYLLYFEGGHFMFIEASDNHGKKSLRLVKGQRMTLENGKKVNRKQIILTLGPMERFDDGMPNYLERLKESFKAGKPIIKELEPYVEKKIDHKIHTIRFEEYSDDCVGSPKLFSHCLIERIMEELELPLLFRTYKFNSKINFDLMGFFRLLVYGRILAPASKIATVAHNEVYYNPILKPGFNEFKIYDTLDFVYDNRNQIFKRINSMLMKKSKRNTDLVYYDVTNFFFEIDSPDFMTDENGFFVEDENGKPIADGLRQMGVSKENRKQPIVQMGLFMDEDGIPISIETFKGNTLDHLTVKDSLNNTINNMNLKRFIFVGDRGMCTGINCLRITSQGNGYVVSKSIAKSNDETKQWIFNNSDYIEKDTGFKYKSKVVKRTITDDNGVKRSFHEKVVVYWSKKFYDHEYYENKRFLDMVSKIIENPNNYRISKSQSKKLSMFFYDKYVNCTTGEIIDASKLKPMIDEKKVEEYKARMGYYQIVTSELTMSEEEVIDTYHGLSRIEDQFRVMKGDLQTRPIRVKTEEHIIAHLTICAIALIIMRIIQNKVSKLLKAGNKHSNEKNWSYGMSAAKVIDALNKWQVDKLPTELYRFNNLNDSNLKTILKAFDIEIPKKLYSKSELRSIKTGIKIFDN